MKSLKNELQAESFQAISEAVVQLRIILNTIENKQNLTSELCKPILRIVCNVKGSAWSNGFSEVAYIFNLFEHAIIKLDEENYIFKNEFLELFNIFVTKSLSQIKKYDKNLNEKMDFADLILKLQNFLNQKNNLQKNYNIAIIDDDSSTREIIAEIISEQFSANIMEFDNPKLFLDNHLNSKFDLIITDYNMPLIDGSIFIKMLRLFKDGNKNSESPILFVSGENPNLDIEDKVWDNVYFIEKPFTFQKISYYAKISLLK